MYRFYRTGLNNLPYSYMWQNSGTLQISHNAAFCSFQDIIQKLDISISDMVGNFSEIVKWIYLLTQHFTAFIACM